MQRISPQVNCICGSRDWYYDDSETRWRCYQCLISGAPIPPRPEWNEVFDYNAWREGVMEDWDTVFNLRQQLDESQEPEDTKGKLILMARRKKVNDEYERCRRLADLATYVETIRISSPSGDLYLQTPDLEIRVKW